MRNVRGALVLGTWLVLSGLGVPAAPIDVPPELEPWRQWALDGEQFRRCPIRANATSNDADSFVCAWPGRLTLEVTASGGRFSQRWRVYAESWIGLPGDAEHWPRDVRLDDATAAVVEHDGSPQLRLAPGTHAISGTFRWSRRPESLAVPDLTALVDLTVDGQRVEHPERSERGLWLGKRHSAPQQEQMD